MTNTPNLDAASYTAALGAAQNRQAAVQQSAGAAGGGINVVLPASLRATPAQKQAMATKTAKDFEAFFVTSMMEFMYTGMKPDKLFGGGQGEQMYRSLLNQEYGKVIADRGGLGIANEVRSEMLRAQEKRN